VERADPSGDEAALKAKMQAREKEGRGEDEMLTPEQRLERNIITGASALCRFQASVTPPRLLPGQTGILRIVASLQGDAVIPSPAPLEVLSGPNQGPITLGASTIRPAAPGQLAKAYLGRPVYDNYAVLEMPVTMGMEAELGKKHQVKVDLKFDLFSGTSGTVFGRYLDHATAEIEVGSSPVPVAGAAPAALPSTPAANEVPVTSPPAAGPAGDAAGATGPVQGHVIAPAEPAPSPVAVAPTPNVLPTASAEGELPPFLLIGGGALLLVVVLLFVRRK
jgi:hypothetical protein